MSTLPRPYDRGLIKATESRSSRNQFLTAFPDHMIGASLKPSPRRSRPALEARLPRPYDRGLIEALVWTFDAAQSCDFLGEELEISVGVVGCGCMPAERAVRWRQLEYWFTRLLSERY